MLIMFISHVFCKPNQQKKKRKRGTKLTKGNEKKRATFEKRMVQRKSLLSRHQCRGYGVIGDSSIMGLSLWNEFDVKI